MKAHINIMGYDWKASGWQINQYLEGSKPYMNEYVSVTPKRKQ